MMPPAAWKMARGVAKKQPDEDSSCQKQMMKIVARHDEDCSSPGCVDWAGMLSWMRSEEKVYADKNKRKAEEHEEKTKRGGRQNKAI
jgi:hypothetical protein